MMPIQSSQNEKIKELKKRQGERTFYWWEGERFFEEVMKCEVTPHTLVYTERFFDKKGAAMEKMPAQVKLCVSERVFKSVSFTEHPQGIGGLIDTPSFSLPELTVKNLPLFYLAGLQDPGNVGTIVRIAEAFGFGGVIYERRGVSPYNEKAVRSSAGSILRVKCLEGNSQTLTLLKKRGYNIFFLTPRDSGARYAETVKKKIGKKVVFVLGQEGRGIDFALDGAEKLYLPMSKDVESLNVAVAAGIIGYLTYNEAE